MSCLFCGIVKKEIPSKIILEKKNLIVFRDIHPKARLHLLIVSKKHIESIDHLSIRDINLIGKMIAATQEIARRFKVVNKYKLVFNVGQGGGQSIGHLHMHFLSGRQIKMP